MAVILAIDIGSSSVKAALVESAGAGTLGPVAREIYAIDQPVPDAAEVPLPRLWEAVVAAVTKVTANRAGDGVAGIGFSCMTPALALLDRHDRALAPAWTHLDRRSRPFARKIWQEHGTEFLAECGNRPLPGGISAVCFGQLAQERPRLRDSVRSYLHLNGWLAFHLTGEKYFDTANASFTGLYPTIAGGEWSARWCDVFGVDRAWLPPVVGGDHTAGILRREPAAELGVPAGIPVKLGTADTTCSMLALGMKKDDLLHGIGTTQVLLQIVDKPRPAETRLVRRLGVGPDFVHVTHNPVGGAALEWIRQLCFREQDRELFYESTVPAAAEAKPWASPLALATRVRLDPPFLGGDRLQIEASHAAFRELSLWSRREDLLAALIEAMRRGQDEAWRALGGSKKLHRVFLTGGGAATIRRLLPQYESADVRLVAHASLLGAGKLFG